MKAYVDADPGGGTPVIQADWNPTATPETVIGRINSQLIERDRWNGPKTIDWGQVFRDLRTAIQLAVAYKRRDPDVPWRLHGALYELHGEDWALIREPDHEHPCRHRVSRQARPRGRR